MSRPPASTPVEPWSYEKSLEGTLTATDEPNVGVRYRCGIERGAIGTERANWILASIWSVYQRWTQSGKRISQRLSSR